jgi:hypothetical protein
MIQVQMLRILSIVRYCFCSWTTHRSSSFSIVNHDVMLAAKNPSTQTDPSQHVIDFCLLFELHQMIMWIVLLVSYGIFEVKTLLRHHSARLYWTKSKKLAQRCKQSSSIEMILSLSLRNAYCYLLVYYWFLER